jgi:hypothetical protein
MLNRLLLLWRRLVARLMPSPPVPKHHDPFQQPYQPSNLHGRRR